MNDTTQAASAGIGKLKTQWMDFAGNLLAPVAVLAAGGTKCQAAWAGMKDVLLTKVLGPIGMVAGAATGFLLLTKKLVSEWKVMGVQSAKAVETLTLQFKPLLGSMELAKKRAREIMDFSVKTPFKFNELAAGNKVLEGLTRGALSGKAGMELVGDAAAVAGAGFEETARSVGRLYDGIMSGRPVGEAGMRLQELGLISGQTRNAIEAMTAANASGSAIWAVVAKDMERTKGAMNDLSASLEGLESTYEDTRTQLDAGFGKGFMEGEKAALKSSTDLLEKMTPVATKLGEVIGNVSNGWENLKAWVKGAVTGFDGFSTVAGVAATAVVGFAASLTLAAGGLIAKFALGLKSAGQAAALLQQATVAGNAATTVGTVVTTQLASAKAALAAVMKSLQAGNAAAAVANLRLAAAETLVAVRTNALAAAQGILRGGLNLAWVGVKLVTSSLYSMTAAILATPMFWFAAAVVALGTALAFWYNESKRAREELDALNAAAKATVANLEAQARSIRTVADLRKAEADVVRELSGAYEKLAQAEAEGDQKKIAIAKKNIEDIKAAGAVVRGKTGKTVLSDEQVATEDAAKARAKEAALAQGDDKAGRGEQSALEVAQERKAEGDRLRAAAEKDKEEKRRVGEKQVALQNAAADNVAPEDGLLKRQAALKESLATKVVTGGGVGMSIDAGAAAAAAREKELKELAEVEAALRRINELRDGSAGGQSQVALESESELVRLEEQLAIYGRIKTAQDAVTAAIKAKEDAYSGDKKDPAKIKDAEKSLEQAKREQELVAKLAGQAGVSGWGELDEQNNGRRRDELKTTMAENTDPEKERALAKAERDAELGLTQARIDAESQVASLRLKGYEREKAMLDFAQQRLDADLKGQAIDQAKYDMDRKILSEQQAALEKAAAEKRGELKDAYELAGLARKEEAARAKGDQGAADALRAQQDAIKDAQVRKDALKEAQDSGYAPDDYAAKQVAEAQAARAQERAKQEEERKAGRARSEANQGSGQAELQARVLEMQGKSAAAKRVEDAAARKQDDLDREEKKKGYIDQGFTGEKAKAMADTDVKTTQAERMMQELMGNKGTIVASSLAQVGGGGNVGGTDPTVRLQERMVKLLEDIADPNKENVGATMRP